MKGKRILSCFLAILMTVATIPLTFSATAEVSGKVVYVASTGSDDNDGISSEKPFQTLAMAYTSLGDAGGTIVIMDAVENETANWKPGNFKKFSHTGLITITGKDPLTGKIYPDAHLFHNAAPLRGPTTIEYVAIRATRASCFINTCGYKFIVGEGVTLAKDSEFGLYVHDGIGETFGSKAMVDSTDTEINSGAFTAFFIGGGYPRYNEDGTLTAGVSGDCKFVMNGGSIANLVIGFDKYQSDIGYMNGNVLVEINGGSITALRSQNVADKIKGYVTIILNNGLTVVPTAVQSDKGIYTVYSGENGKVHATDKIGTFKVEAKKGYVAVMDDKEIENGEYEFPIGDTKITYKRRVAVSINQALNAYIAGYTDGTFKPESNMTRAEAITIITRLIADENEIKSNYRTDYTDVKEGDWYYDYVAYLDSIGVLTFFSGNELLPNQNITRGEFVQLIYNISESKASSEVKLGTIDDVEESNKYINAIFYALSEGIVTGYPDGTFKTDNTITRAEVVTVINRLLKRNPTGEAGDISFSDIDGHWAAGQILASANAKGNAWTEGAASGNKFVLPEGTAKDYILSLYENSSELTASEIREGVDLIAEQMKKNVLNAKDNLPTNGTVYYVSEDGNDINPGTSPDKPIKTFKRLNFLPYNEGDVVLFNRGDVFRGQLLLKSGVSYGAYGEGEKPVMMGSAKNYADSALWVQTDVPNVYKLTDKITNVGIIAFDHNIYDHGNYNELYGKIKVRGVDSFNNYNELKNDLEFFSDLSTNDLFLYSAEGNPGNRFKSIEIGASGDIFDASSKLENMVIDNLSFKFGGCHGIGVGNVANFTVQNCEFSWVGGSILRGYAGGDLVEYGNAVETGQCDGYYIQNSWFYQLYDTAVTHQTTGPGNYTQNDVRYSENLMEYVHWGIEFYNAPQENSKKVTKNTIDEYNLLRMGGYGWGSIVRKRQSSARLYCGSSFMETSNLKSQYNILDRCAGLLLNLPAGVDFYPDKNIYIQTKGYSLGYLRGTTVVCDFNAKKNIEDKWGDKNAVVIVANS